MWRHKGGNIVNCLGCAREQRVKQNALDRWAIGEIDKWGNGQNSKIVQRSLCSPKGCRCCALASSMSGKYSCILVAPELTQMWYMYR